MGSLKTWEYPGGHGRGMPKALLITAVATEGRLQEEAARSYGVPQGWMSRLVARYAAEGRRRSGRSRGGRGPHPWCPLVLSCGFRHDTGDNRGHDLADGPGLWRGKLWDS